MPAHTRRRLGLTFIACILAGAILGFGVLRYQLLEFRLILIALASGFLITTVTQSMIPAANKECEPMAFFTSVGYPYMH